MADFFGGILDDLQGYATDVGSFFDSAIGRALATGAKAGYGGEATGEQAPRQSREMGVGTAGNTTVGEGRGLQSEDFSAAELRWLQRMKSFANLDTGTTVQLKG